VTRITALLAIACSLITGGVAATATAAAPTGAGAKTITIQARSKLLRVKAVDNQPAGASAGDVLVFTERLYNRSGKVIGSDLATCTSLFDQRSLCAGAYLLRGGELFVSLVQPGLSGRRDYAQAITGATGRYGSATGTVTVHQRPGGDRFVFHIRVPAR
jgi:hypothetical protein